MFFLYAVLNLSCFSFLGRWSAASYQSLCSKHTGCSTLCILCPKWLLQIWSCMQIWSPNGCTGLQFISFTPIWHANCSLPSWFFCCHFGSTFVFARIYFNQRPIYQSSSVTSGSTRACWSSLAKRGFPSRYHYANSDFYYSCRQFKPWWGPLISELNGVISSAQFFCCFDTGWLTVHWIFVIA